MSWKEILKRISERELLDAREFAEEDMARDVKHFRPDAWGGPGHTSYYSAKQIEAKELFDRWEKWIESHSEWINKQTDDVKELIKDMKDNIYYGRMNPQTFRSYAIKLQNIVDKLNLEEQM